MSEFTRQIGPLIMLVIGLYAGGRIGNAVSKKTGTKATGWAVGVLAFLVVWLGGTAFF